ncbi:MAG TPA: hypothetical protein VG297_25670 [Bryobacteraceae bacterium]|jgi:hypothetical protein|nr:hypothetical protein [Bryobacteraceae bacterium]
MPEPKPRKRTWRIWAIRAAAGIVVVIVSGVAVTAKHWPFSRDTVARDLQGRVKGRLVIGRFHETWFPPGYIAADVKVLPDKGNDNALISARDLVVRGSYYGLLRHTILKAKVVGLRLAMPAGGWDALFVTGVKSSSKNIDELEIDDSAWISGKLRFDAKQIVLRDVGPNRTVRFRASLVTDKPRGELKGEGQAGPWKSGTGGQTPIAGIFQYANADLATFANLHGILAARGNFQGTLTNVNVSGTLSVPDFRVARSVHAVALTAAYRASVNARNADVALDRVEAHVAHTTILANGRIDGQKGQEGKTAHIELAVHKGRVEDLLNYFSEEQTASMTGAVTLHAFAEVPPGPHFLRKLRLTGDFGVDSGKFTSPSTQAPISALSASARAKEEKEDKADADKEGKAEKEEKDTGATASNLRAHVLVRNGMAELTGISFEFPGAIANMDGTFQLISKQVDIHGDLRTTGSLSHTTSGFKALMLKVAAPFMKKRNTTVAPFAITGTSSDPRVGLDLSHKRKF